MPARLTLVLACSFGLSLGLEESFSDSLFPPLGWVAVNADSGVREWQRLDIGYRTGPGDFHLKGALEQRGLESIFGLKPPVKSERIDWLAQAVKQGEFAGPHSLATRLDLEILRIRADIE